ncbi:hypothetical protein BpsM61_00020 [Bacillus phage vB_BpsM-61]|nr:hypothetical protein BpsM61_00020 [Bacillus phage vB_BpsM-61]
MARVVIDATDKGKQVVTVYEEGEKKRKIKKEYNGFNSIGVMHKSGKGYKFENEKGK